MGATDEFDSTSWFAHAEKGENPLDVRFPRYQGLESSLNGNSENKA
jgi:hypothetical protein